MTHQIIRTTQELEALDPDTIIVEQGGSMTALAAMRIGPGWFLPAVVLATGEQVRAARKALEDAS